MIDASILETYREYIKLKADRRKGVMKREAEINEIQIIIIEKINEINS
jgi:hypothetical protein